MALTAKTGPRGETVRLRLRKNVSRLTAAEVRTFRRAMAAFIARSDDRGFQFYAGWHGVPFDWCKHNDPLFLPWHRAYLYHFELALQDEATRQGLGEVALPWWDWANDPGVPAAYDQARVDGKANPLASAPIKPFVSTRQSHWPRKTRREVGQIPDVLSPPLGDRWQWMMAAPSFTEFDRRVTLVHNNMHVWVGGTMLDPDWAAYDPIFWAHHTMVDRAWRIWQHHHPGATPGADILDMPLELGKRPILTPRQTLDVKQLGYEYAASSSSSPGTL